MDKNGQWYTDENGNHYFVEDGQSPKEGWEASKRRKMISGGKYMTSEDGNDYREVNKDEYDNYESDETDFDETNDDDFGFDEEENMPEYEYSEIFSDSADKQIERYAEHYGVDASELKDEIYQKALDKIREGDSLSNARNDAMEEVLDSLDPGSAPLDDEDEEYNTEMKKAQEENAEESVAAEEIKEEEQETYSDDDLGYRKNDKGGFDILVKETEDRDEKLLKSVNSRDEARQYIRSLLGKDKNVSDYKEFSSDSEARKYFDEHANELPDGSALYGNKIYLGEDKNKGNPYDPEKLPDEGMSQEELDGIPHEPVDMPKYHKEKEHIVIDEGPHQGESYDSEEDYYNSVRSEGQKEENPYNREEKVTEYLKEQGFDDDYINKTLENMKKNMNIGQFWDRFFKDKEEK